MPATDPNEFTDREKFILHYYRDANLSGSGRMMYYDVAIALASLGCVAYAALNEDAALGFVGYVLLLGRLYYLATEGERVMRDFQSIFAKYEAKLKALSESQQQNGQGIEPDKS